MSEAHAEKEPTMEEILDSIRKIISEDDEQSEAESLAKTDERDEKSKEIEALDDSSVEEGEEDDIIELTEVLEGDLELEEQSGQTTEAESAEIAAMIFESPEADSESPQGSQSEEETDVKSNTSQAKAKDESLISESTSSSVTAALADFAGEVQREKVQSTPDMPVGPTLDVLVRQVLEPVLKSWLDENLEPLVERVVREEIRRMARRAEDV